MITCDFLICGSGIAGASMAYELAPHGKVVVVEQESQHGRHTTGRSAALYIESYGPEPVRRLTAASRAFFDAPAPGFADYPLLSVRGCLNIAGPDRLDELARFAEGLAVTGAEFREVSGEAARERIPLLKPQACAAAVFEPNACDIDTNGLHAGYLKLARARGAEFRLNARLERLEPDAHGWRAGLADGETVQARVVVNAAGAWADRVAALAGVRPLGMTPLRRTALLLDPPAGLDFGGWPMVVDVDEQFYFKPDAGRILASPCDETPSEPLDAAPEELDIAICVDRLQAACDLPVRRVARAWAGLRTFCPDRVEAFGYDATAPGFFWYVGQGGYGMQTAPAAARLGAALALGHDVPPDLAEHGFTPQTLSPARFAEPRPMNGT
ncbi:MAG TPA: FAD-binding oxidoreductase [Phenylobacterium sp.]|nr:FAD-binding oxidoreductase [Phenylobacterium sp.]